MLTVKILGSGCANCKRLEAETRAALDELSLDYELLKITDWKDIASYGVMTTPALIINEKLLTAGRIPKRQQIAQWAQELQNA